MIAELQTNPEQTAVKDDDSAAYLNEVDGGAWSPVRFALDESVYANSPVPPVPAASNDDLLALEPGARASDAPRKRLAVAAPLAALVNIVLLSGAGVYTRHVHVADTLPPAEVTLVQTERTAPNAKLTYKPLPKPSPIPTPKPTPTPRATPTPVSTPTPVAATPTSIPVNPTPRALNTPSPKKTTTPPPEGAHNRILTAKSDASNPPKPGDHVVLSSGNARLGAPMAQQREGSAVSAPAGPTSPVRPSATPTPQPVVVATPAPAPTPIPTPIPTPVPTPTPKPKPAGPTRAAEVATVDKPEIPDHLKSGDFKAFVRVRVEVDANGSATDVTLRTSSGNDEVDKRVADVLKRGKYKPALNSGVPVSSTLLFKYEIEVE